jgi:hypothetical protein
VSAKISDMVGKTFESVTGDKGGTEMVFLCEDGTGFDFSHDQDCCEHVEIEDVCGDLSALVGSPLVLAEEVNSDDFPAPEKEYVESYTWTFYRFATAKGTVTVRWLGESNGYYSERVDLHAIGERR